MPWIPTSASSFLRRNSTRSAVRLLPPLLRPSVPVDSPQTSQCPVKAVADVVSVAPVERPLAVQPAALPQDAEQQQVAVRPRHEAAEAAVSAVALQFSGPSAATAICARCASRTATPHGSPPLNSFPPTRM